MPKKPPPKILAELEAKCGSLPGYRVRPMFGGHGVYLGEQIFAVVDDGHVYFHTDDETRPTYESAGMTPFEYAPGQFLKSYYGIPSHVWKDDVLLKEWAIRAATRPVKPKKTRKKMMS